FSQDLRRHRLAAGLTQEALAERAGLGVRSIQALERGESRPHRDTARALAAGLGLDQQARATFLAVATPAPRHPIPGGPTDKRPLRASAAAGSPHNLPAALSSLIGWETERGEVGALLRAGRLLTLTGRGGVGKTRLALAVAAELVDQYDDGVWLVELAALSEPTLVPGTMAQALGVREEVGRPLTATLTDHLKQKQMLLVLDNCEHLVGTCAALAGALLRACPRLCILATSREGLEVAGGSGVGMG